VKYRSSGNPIPNAYKVKNKFQLEQEGTGIIQYFCGILDPAAVQDCTKFQSLLTYVLLQLVRDIINGACYQRYEKRLEQKKVVQIGGLRPPNKAPSIPKWKYETL